MKTTYGRFGIFTLTLALLFLLFGIQFQQQNHRLYQTISDFHQTIEQERDLQNQNVVLKKKFENNKDVLSELSRYLVLPKKEISDITIEVYDPEVQHNVSIHQNYLTGFVAYDDCVKVLEKLCELQLPILITSLSIHRNIAHNYALQIAMTYRTK